MSLLPIRLGIILNCKNTQGNKREMVLSQAPNREMTASASSEDGDVLDLADDEGWDDLEPDVEIVKVFCLVCDVIFDGAQSMLEHCKKNHQLDIVSIQKDLGEHAR